MNAYLGASCTHSPHLNSQAKDHYIEAAGLFLKAMKDEVHPKREELLKDQAMNFLEQAEQVCVGGGLLGFDIKSRVLKHISTLPVTVERTTSRARRPSRR